MKNSGKPNRQVERTKSWIFDALMILMDEKPFSKITIQDITEKAGIARQTFYYNYKDKDDVILEYLLKTINKELLIIGNTAKGDKDSSITLMFDHEYMIKHQKTLKKILSVVDVEDRIVRDVRKLPIALLEQYREKLSDEEFIICRYKICYQITGSLSLLFDWFMSDMPMPIEDVVRMINSMNIPKTIQYRNIPSIVVKLKNG